MRLTLEHGQAVVVRAQALDKECVAVEQHVLRRHGGRHGGRGRGHKLRSLPCGDVLQDYAQVGHAVQEGDLRKAGSGQGRHAVQEGDLHEIGSGRGRSGGVRGC